MRQTHFLDWNPSFALNSKTIAQDTGVIDPDR